MKFKFGDYILLNNGRGEYFSNIYMVEEADGTKNEYPYCLKNIEHIRFKDSDMILALSREDADKMFSGIKRV
jgi:hypothetical protein